MLTKLIFFFVFGPLDRFWKDSYIPTIDIFSGEH